LKHLPRLEHLVLRWDTYHDGRGDEFSDEQLFEMVNNFGYRLKTLDLNGFPRLLPVLQCFTNLEILIYRAAIPGTYLKWITRHPKVEKFIVRSVCDCKLKKFETFLRTAKLKFFAYQKLSKDLTAILKEFELRRGENSNRGVQCIQELRLHLAS